jgi:hypothetical protein
MNQTKSMTNMMTIVTRNNLVLGDKVNLVQSSG